MATLYEKSKTLQDILASRSLRKAQSSMNNECKEPSTVKPVQKRRISPKPEQAWADQEERKGTAQPARAATNTGIYDYMRDAFYNISYMYKGGLDRKQLARSLNSINDSNFMSGERQQKPVAYVLNEKFTPINVRASRHFNTEQESHAQYVNKVVNEIEEAFESVTWFTYRAAINHPLHKSKMTSDAGWGCMLRTGQMMLC